MTSSDHDPRYLAGIEHFNAGDYFEAHEVWEDLWHECSSADRLFYQSLIQAAVALYHFNNANDTGARRLFASGKQKMDGYRPWYHGLDVERFWLDVQAALAPALADGPVRGGH